MWCVSCPFLKWKPIVLSLVGGNFRKYRGTQELRMNTHNKANIYQFFTRCFCFRMFSSVRNANSFIRLISSWNFQRYMYWYVDAETQVKWMQKDDNTYDDASLDVFVVSFFDFESKTQRAIKRLFGRNGWAMMFETACGIRIENCANWGRYSWYCKTNGRHWRLVKGNQRR